MGSEPFRLFVIICLVLTKSSWAQIDYKGFPQWSWHQQDSTEYYLYTPSQSSKSGLYPIVLFLHGCCGENYHATLRNTVDPPVRMWHNYGANTQSEPTFIIAPATSRGWKQHIKNLKAVMDDLVQNHNGDSKRIYITGFSMGANGTWEFLQQYPNYFAAALPMGMDFHGDPKKIKDIPIWTNQGETDPFAKNLQKDVWEIRRLNSNNIDSSQRLVTGVNPRYTNFKGHGHVVQWVAASTQDLTGWAYSKVNDGNNYPVAFFSSPIDMQAVKKGTLLPVVVQASDLDGSISKVIVKLNGLEKATLTKSPYKTTLRTPAGDALIEAIAYDNKGKSSVATTIVRSDVKTTFLTTGLSFARQGAYYEDQLLAFGNGTIQFSLPAGTVLPQGLAFSQDGLLSGVPQVLGDFPIKFLATDEDGDITSMQYRLTILGKNKDEVLVTNAKNDAGMAFPIGKLRLGGMTHVNRGDDEVSVSQTAGYEGMTLIPGNVKDTNRTNADYLSFDVDEKARVYVAYEKKDNLFSSTIPAWLQQWQRSPSSQIVTQYFYYDVYYKDFPKGKVVLPGADEKRNGVSNNYFVLVRKVEAPFQYRPEINTGNLHNGYLGLPYKKSLTALHGTGEERWTLTSGKLPKGLRLTKDGTIEGVPEEKGRFWFGVKIDGEKGAGDSKNLSLEVKADIE